MSKFVDQRYLLTEQYRDASNLRARQALHQRFSTNRYGWLRWVFDHFNGLPAHSCILELGCGPGTLWSENAGHIPAGWTVTLTDLSPGMLAEAGRNLRDIPHHFSYASADAQALPFADASFDALIANHMLYHVPDRERAYAEIRRVLRPGGRFYAATNGRDSMRELKALARRLEATTTAPEAGIELGFTLENGGEELSRRLAQVVLQRYDDALVVTEAEPLVAYLLSTARFLGIAEDRRAQVTALVQQEIDAHGAIHIAKETGLFTALRPDDA